ncbi:Cucumber peeling cupredoxin-like protein [Quillaja saponaria]|uniref:Cucumber peeling cupredoxin-like protein n=1 Tax=Quillaja saponaria TaxID=32244 RepID=A0AAD7PE19_QUISA|nr:Cucumber peeling cupredoxin-like protein [Quillaja saponaria]
MALKMYRTLFVVAAISSVMVSVSASTTHVVGDQQGWILPDNPNFYADWAKNKTFAVGDKLAFHYKAGSNNVVEVSKEDYEGCTVRNLLNTYYKGETVLTLDREGDYYYFCEVGKHCEAGQKLHVTVCKGHGH